MAPSSPNVSAPSSASTLPRSQTSSATPRSPPDWRSTAPGTVKIPEPIVVPTTMRTRSRSVRTRASCRGAGADISELREHQRAREDGRHRVGDPFARERRRRAVHRLEQPRSPPTRVKISAGGEPQPADERGAKVGKDVAVQVVGHDDLEALRLAYQLHRQGVHVAVLGFDATELGGDALEGLLPDLVSGHRVRFIAHGDADLAAVGWA